jgi:hypothetical protein
LKLLKRKQGQVTLGGTPNLVVVFGTIAITLAVMALVIGGVKDSAVAQQTNAGGAENASFATNITIDGLTGLTNMGDFLPVVGLVLIAAVIIGLLVFFRRSA